MRKGTDNILTSLALIVALSILLVLAITNPFQNGQIAHATDTDSYVNTEAASGTSSISEASVHNEEPAFLESTTVHTQTEEALTKPMMAITDIDAAITEPEPPRYTEDDLFCLAAAIYQEAGAYGSSNDTRMLIGNVVLNRVKSDLYPDTIREVLEQYGQWGTMWTDGVEFPADAKEDYAQAAVENVYDCARRLLEGERVCPDNVLFAAEFEQGGGVYTVSDGIFFCCAQ